MAGEIYAQIPLMVLSISSTTASHSHNPRHLNTSHSSSNSFSKGMPMHFVHQLSELRPLKPSNHRLINMQHTYTPSVAAAAKQHETLHLLEHFRGVQPNYYSPRNGKSKLMFPPPPPQWRMPLMPDNHFERHSIDRPSVSALSSSSFSNQIPRPPRLTRTQSDNRRHYIDSESEQPRPFNFPLEGPQPSEFKKTKKSKKKENKVNNIQDILRQEPLPANVNQYQMPVGIHISGSFKNLQNSGISNVFRRYIQVQPQIAQSQVNYQRVAIDPFYPYKPKSLNDINSLAMKQLGLNRKKKKTNNTAVAGLVFQPSGQRPVSADYYLEALRMNNSLNGLGAQRNLKHEPFSLKLEVYPIRSGKKAPIVPLTVAPFLTTIQPMSQNFQPFYPAQMGTPYGMPVDNGANYLNYMNMNMPQRHKGKLAHSPSLYSSAYQRDKSPLESDALNNDGVHKPREKKPKSSANQLMVHLNVFPSKKDNNIAPPPPPLPQNHLYDVIHADVHERSSGDLVENKYKANKTSTYNDCDVGEKTFEETDVLSSTDTSLDYQKGRTLNEAPVVVENYAPSQNEQHKPQELTSTKNVSGNRTENNSEKFSTFRFPVENLLQFQANDAVINN
ncbi:uncharacterized protein LOC129945165 [Eupeodes corollae]|uniref:uncharacterized protein LOC129945165 n=1 Tax=Eupeodes corollae TaxID=290404 RepID=UPI002491DAD4|nr:uncharacterized protein LOC129945165 [Eupeodes corollae]